MTLCVAPDSAGIELLRMKIAGIESLAEPDFRRLEYDLVAHYRRFDDDQEWIAVELTRKNISSLSPVGRRRIDEILAMLDHVHDPLIAAVS